jgi:hypothetical protein
VAQVYTVAAHQDALFKQEFALHPPLREAPIGADDAMPRETLVGGRKNSPDKAGRTGIDVAIGADKPSGDRAHSADDAGCPRLGTVRVRLNRAARTSPATFRVHRPSGQATHASAPFRQR